MKGNGKVLKGNHEHMLVDAHKKRYYYAPNIWTGNGAFLTLESYGYSEMQNPMKVIPEDHIDFMDNLPLKFEIEADGKKAIVTHGTLHGNHTVEKCLNLGGGFYGNLFDPDSEHCILWNRTKPTKRDYFQIYGHNSRKSYEEHKGKGGKPYAVCIDTWKGGHLTALLWPEMVYFKEKM